LLEDAEIKTGDKAAVDRLFREIFADMEKAEALLQWARWGASSSSRSASRSSRRPRRRRRLGRTAEGSTLFIGR